MLRHLDFSPLPIWYIRLAVVTPFAVVMASWSTIVVVVGFTFVGLAAKSFKRQLPWLSLAVLAIYLLATHPFLL
ncbi:hypothetical protein [Mycobacterium leprae]|uniref:hypothetical protein n=1 Tax=Mycobacterium leprae TaxID=1769 RepID=UPI0018D3A909|nr:hypothetical protein [Mycobacterium leprae]